MVHYSDSSDGEDEKDKKDDKEGKVISKALPQEQAKIRFRYRGKQHPLMLKLINASGRVCVNNETVSFSLLILIIFQVLYYPGTEEKHWQLSEGKKMISCFFETAEEMSN